ncbi:MAG: hypothetical protein HYW47_03670 [Deltaproteobacteria bacterium]|nr:hypothetical protein [Deltaproteobacteria bacterium]
MNTMILSFKLFCFILFTFTLSCTTIDKVKPFNWEMEAYHNERFEFTLNIPKEFKTKYPDNGDGITLIHPQNNKIKILAWGNHNALFQTFEQRIQEINKGQRIVDMKDINLKHIKGKRIISEVNDSRSLRILFYDYDNDIFYSILCESPKSDFNQYQKLFEKILESIHIES